MIGTIERHSIYTEDATTGTYSTLAKSGLRCRARHPDGGESLPERSELAATRVLIWEAGYVMPRYAQVDINGERWQIHPETIASLDGPGGQTIYRRAYITRAG